jgi:hypothetical protein
MDALLLMIMMASPLHTLAHSPQPRQSASSTTRNALGLARLVEHPAAQQALIGFGIGQFKAFVQHCSRPEVFQTGQAHFQPELTAKAFCLLLGRPRQMPHCAPDGRAQRGRNAEQKKTRQANPPPRFIVQLEHPCSLS